MFAVNFANYYISEPYEKALFNAKKEQSFFRVPLYKVSRNRKKHGYYRLVSGNVVMAI